MRDVFRPTGIPTHTLIDRSRSPEFDEIRFLVADVGGLISVYGNSKSGKTTLCLSLLERYKPILFHGTLVQSDEDFWTSLAEAFGLGVEREEEHGAVRLSGSETTGGGAVGDGASWRIGGERTEVRLSETARRTTARFRTNRKSIVDALVESRRPIVIDDFHVVPESVRASLIFGLKAAIDRGVTVVVVSIPEVTEELVPSRPGAGEAIGRRAVVSGPPWTAEEIAQIPMKGFAALKVTIDDETVASLVRYSYRNPLLIQHHCLRLCFDLGVAQRQNENRTFTVDPKVLREVVSKTASQYDDIFAHAITSSAEGKTWRLASGESVNIYLLIMLSIAGIAIDSPVKVQTLRRRISEILAEGVSPPNDLVIHNGLVQLSRRMDDGTVDPVFRYDVVGKYAYVAHPFFKLFLQWSLVPRYAAVVPKLRSAGVMEPIAGVMQPQV